MMKTFSAVALICSFGFTVSAEEHAAFTFPRSTPEAQGISSAAILDFVETADQTIHDIHSVMIVRHGYVVAEGWWTPYDAATPHHLFSLSKSFTSTAVGLAIDEGHFTLDDRVLDIFPEDAPEEPDDNLKAMRVRDLLTMTVGQKQEKRLREVNDKWTKAFLAHPVDHPPGTRFQYNTSATYMLSAIVQRRTGEKVVDYLQPRLFRSLGIENPKWDECPQGVSLGGYGLHIRTEDIARFGQLYLQNGMWNGKQLIPASWVALATTKQVNTIGDPDNDWAQGYGFQFWRSRHNCFRGDGMYGQFCIVVPEHDAIVVTTSGTNDMAGIMQLVWDKVLPALQPSALPAADDDTQRLRKTLKSLALPHQEGSEDSPVAKRVSGNRYRFDANDAGLEEIGIERGDDGIITLIMHSNGKNERVVCGQSGWANGRMALLNRPEQPVAISAAWPADDTLAAKICLRETPYTMTLTLQFSDDQVTVSSELNLRSLFQAPLPNLTGKLAAAD